MTFGVEHIAYCHIVAFVEGHSFLQNCGVANSTAANCFSSRHNLVLVIAGIDPFDFLLHSYLAAQRQKDCYSPGLHCNSFQLHMMTQAFIEMHYFPYLAISLSVRLVGHHRHQKCSNCYFHLERDELSLKIDRLHRSYARFFQLSRDSIRKSVGIGSVIVIHRINHLLRSVVKMSGTDYTTEVDKNSITDMKVAVVVGMNFIASIAFTEVPLVAFFIEVLPHSHRQCSMNFHLLH